jgi:glycosyltransferase involved in cell wall biosynthesis
MKLLVFAHIPPPHHGQSYMVKLMLDGFGGDIRARGKSGVRDAKSEIECFHVDARVSDTMEDIGSFRFGKLLLILRYCFEAIWCRIRYGVRSFYYVPAPGKRAALYRDWLVMLLCRPFFRHFVHHWHAFGLGDWLKKDGSWLERRITHWLLGRPSLGLSLAIPSMRDALWFHSDRVELVPNGIPDPCPNFGTAVLPRRKARLAARRALIEGQPAGDDERKYRVLFLANLLRDKGTFDALEAVALANVKLRAQNSPLRIHLTIAGALPVGVDESEFRARIVREDLAGCVEWAGFVIGEKKSALLCENDCLCFPSYYHAESFGLVVVEAMAAGMAVVTTRWRALPDLLPPGYPGIVPIRRPDLVADALIASMTEDATALRGRFISHFTEAAHLAVLREALLQLDAPG